MVNSTNVAAYYTSPLQPQEIVTMVMDVHQIDDGYGMPQLVDWFTQQTQISSTVVPVFRQKKNGNYVDHNTFVVYYSHPIHFQPVCNSTSDILVFRKSQAGGNLLNIHTSDVRIAKAAIQL
jgi:hypothetical protein